MKIVEVYNNIVRHIVPFWNSKEEIPADVPDIFREAPDDVQEGWLYDPETRKFSLPPEPELSEPTPQSIPPVTNEEVIQATMYVAAMMDVLLDQGVSPKPLPIDSNTGTTSPRYDFWRQSYLKNHTTAYTLQRLVDGGILTQDEVVGIVSDGINKGISLSENAAPLGHPIPEKLQDALALLHNPNKPAEETFEALDNIK